jgi:hypothetical protein
MTSDEEIEFASLFNKTKYATGVDVQKRIKAERRSTMTDKQAARAKGRARSAQINFRTTPQLKELASGLADHLGMTLADMMEKAITDLARAQKFGGAK